jgi:hypothetical protein
MTDREKIKKEDEKKVVARVLEKMFVLFLFFFLYNFVHGSIYWHFLKKKNNEVYKY